MTKTIEEKLLPVASTIAFLLLGFLYLQTMYAALLNCPGNIKWSVIPQCEQRSRLNKLVKGV